MKKSLLIVPLALGLFSCANDKELATPDQGGQNADGELRYLAVNIVDTSNGTRDANNTKDYEDGEDNENAVKTVRFFLFDKDGNLTGSPIDATPELVDGESPNVEKKLQAVIVFEDESTATPPVRIAAIVNPPSVITASDTATLQSTKGDYLKTGEGEFIMTNSVYADYAANNTTTPYEVVTTVIEDTYSTRAEALENPTEIYVERVVAKARVSVAEKGGSVTNGLEKVEGKEGIYKLSSDKETVYDDEGTGTETDVYVKLLGWNVTGYANQSRLQKKVVPTWGYDNSAWIGTNFDWGTSNAWNYPTFFRSFWAQNPDNFGMSNIGYGKFGSVETLADEWDNDDFDATDALRYGFEENSNYTYMQENAAWTQDGKSPTDENQYRTKIIVGAQLVDEDGEAIELGWYKGDYYLQEDLLSVLATASKIYKRSSEGTGYKYEPITGDDLKFVTATASGVYDSDGSLKETTKSDVNRYNSYAHFNSDFTADTYFVKNSAGEYEETALSDINAINTILEALGEVKVWTSGYTYYWFDIEHLGKDGYGDFGVVRNHIYDYTLTSIKGFGIPVGDPGETIYPEIPNDPDMMYIGARINILSWRVVTNNDKSLGWD